MQPEKTERNAALFRDIERGMSIRAAAKRQGLHPNTVWDLLDRHVFSDPVRKVDFFVARLQRAQPCVVCGYWVLRYGPRRTCSSACANVYRVMKEILNPVAYEQVRRRHARRLLRLGDQKRRREAERILAGDALPGRRYFIPGSRRKKVARALGIVPPSSSSPLLPRVRRARAKIL